MAREGPRWREGVVGGEVELPAVDDAGDEVADEGLVFVLGERAAEEAGPHPDEEELDGVADGDGKLTLDGEDALAHRASVQHAKAAGGMSAAQRGPHIGKGRLYGRPDRARVGARPRAAFPKLQVQGAIMSNALISKLAAIAALVGASLASTSAHAADIATVVGEPGSAAWNATCGAAPAPIVPTGASQLPVCAGGGASCMHRVVIDPNEFPQATCSDGTPGVFYVRPGVGADADRWVIHLQGGGHCRDYESCLERWCGQQGNLPYTANKMSSDWDGDGVTDLPEHVTGPGMSSANAANDFSTWTQVWVYYCSSDTWQGRATDVTFTDGVDSFTLDARGHTILYAMRRMLRKLNPDPAWTAADGYTVNDIDDATEIVFTGTSAGAKGAISNADWFLSVFPNADTSLVLDGNFDVSDTALVSEDVWVDYDLDGVGDENYYSARIGLTNAEWAAGGYLAEIDAFTDETCRDWYEPLGRMDRCSQFSTMLRFSIGGTPVIETPTFVRFDLADPVIDDQYVDHPNERGYSLIVGGQLGTPATPQDFRVLMRASLLESYIDHDSVSGVIAPRCAQHVGLETGVPFGFSLTPDSDETLGSPPPLVPATDITVHDALIYWLNVGGGGRLDIRRLDADLGAALSTC